MLPVVEYVPPLLAAAVSLVWFRPGQAGGRQPAGGAGLLFSSIAAFIALGLEHPPSARVYVALGLAACLPAVAVTLASVLLRRRSRGILWALSIAGAAIGVWAYPVTGLAFVCSAVADCL